MPEIGEVAGAGCLLAPGAHRTTIERTVDASLHRYALGPCRDGDQTEQVLGALVCGPCPERVAARRRTTDGTKRGVPVIAERSAASWARPDEEQLVPSAH